MQCPGCASTLDERALLGRRAGVCEGCGGMWMARPDVLALRQARPDEHPLLSRREGDPAAVAGVGGRAAVRACPACGGKMLGHSFAGGNTRVEACDACDAVFLERGELATIVAEAHHGIELSEAARQGLHLHRLETTAERISGAEMGMVAAGVVSLYIFVRIVGDVGATSITVIVAAALALAIFLYWRRKLRKGHADASARLGRLMDAEEYRLARASSGDAPTGQRQEPRPERAPAAETRARAAPRACPFCGAALPAKGSHCGACDSDFGGAA